MENTQDQITRILSSGEFCTECGREINIIELKLLGVTKQIKGTCQCKVDKWERERQELIEWERKRRIDALFSASRLGPRFIECTFDNWKPQPGTEAVYKATTEYFANWREKKRTGEGLLIFGPPGNGKSHLAAAIVNELIKVEVPAVFANVPELLARIRRTYADDARETERNIMYALVECDLLVLDDLAAQRWTEWAEEMLYTTVDERYRRKTPLIVTSNASPKELEASVGPRTMDRLIEMCVFVENKGASYRRKVAKERIKG